MSLSLDPPRKKFATVREAAAFAGVSPRSIRRQIQAGRLPAHRLGRRTLIVLATLDALITGSGDRPMLDAQPQEPPETAPVSSS